MESLRKFLKRLRTLVLGIRFRKLPTPVRALVIGVTSEIVFCAIAITWVLSGGADLAGFKRDAPVFIRLVHLPGAWLSRQILPPGGPGDRDEFWTIVFTGALLSLSAFIFIIAAGKISNRERHVR
jgi:hypothetical protein